MFDFSADTGLAGLFVASFLAATLLPGGSEFVLLGVIERHPATLWPALGVATLGNTLGGMSSYLIGRCVPNPYRRAGLATELATGATMPGLTLSESNPPPKASPRALDWLQRFGHWSLLLAWLPVIGDALCVAAGWMRLSAWKSGVAIAAGKFARYAVLALGWSWLTP